MSEVALMCMGLKSLEDDVSEKTMKSIADANAVNFHCNQLSNLKGLRSIVSITSLNLSSNEFTSADIPELCLLPNLKSLDLAGNFIESIIEFPFLPSLKSLSLAFNRLRSLDGCAYELHLI